MTSKEKISIEPSDINSRLDNFIFSKMKISSRSFVQKIIKEGQVLVNNKVSKPSFKISNENLVIEILLPIKEPQIAKKIQAEDIQLEIIYEDKEIIVINKPSGMVTHPAPGHYTGTLVNALLHKIDIDSDETNLRPGIVHRLDKDTSGLIVVAKNLEAQNCLAKQFKEKSAYRVYQALCYGPFKKDEDIIETFLHRHPKDRKKYSSQNEGKYAKTSYTVLSNGPIAKVKVQLFTGRTHQIRVHLSELGNPIVQDPIYGQNKRINGIVDPKLKSRVKTIPRLALVATELNIIHPTTNELMKFIVDWPKELIY